MSAVRRIRRNPRAKPQEPDVLSSAAKLMHRRQL